MKAVGQVLFAVLLVAAAILLDSLVMVATGGTRYFDPFLLLTVWYGASGGKVDGMLVGGLSGLAQDSVGTTTVFGTHYLSKVVIGYLSMLASSRLIPGQVLTHVVLLAGATVVEVAVLVGAGLLLDQSFNDLTAGQVAVAALVNAALGASAFAMVEQGRRKRSRLHGPARER